MASESDYAIGAVLPADSADGSPETSPRLGRLSKSEREKRTYRVETMHPFESRSSLSRSRRVFTAGKGRYTSGEPGRPPCERCIREQHECVLGGSRRGGKRIKRSASDLTGPEGIQTPTIDGAIRPLSIPPLNDDYRSSSGSEPHLPPWTGLNRQSRMLPPLPQEPPIQGGSKLTVHDKLASTDLQNPADALEFLANVAERNSGRTQLPPMQSSFHSTSHPDPSPASLGLNNGSRSSNGTFCGDMIDFPPLTKGHLTLEIIQTLLTRYGDKYHPFFPLANPSAMDTRNLPTIAAKEPHLLAAILTVASKDEKDWWPVHETCSAHMQQLISELVYSGCGTVEAVEAMLILAEWVPRRPHSSPAVGRGEEDQAAWMYVGTAIRLGYLLGIDRTGFRAESEAQSADLNRQRLAWAACYMSDRQISVRIGKAFWSRGPGPLTGLRAQDFPSLQPRRGNYDDFAAIFQANLELTQLFGNAHDVLYATKSRSNQLNFGGEYVKYIDDFRVALRSWHSTWGVFTCSAPLKASLIFSYEYLRLYINAFAYQATLNRLVAQVQASSADGQQTRSPTYPFADVAATPDARFIYDSIDAAKSLLSTFNSYVDPVETFRFMPLRYYLYVIYSACFLYKARSTGVMGGDTRGSIKRMITDTIDRLQQASACNNDIGDRYSRLVRLLWRKPPGRGSIAEGADTSRAATAHASGTTSTGNETSEQSDHIPYEPVVNPPSINTFSWLDLGAVGDFATQNNSITGSLDSLDRMDESSADGFCGFEPGGMLSQQFAWNGLSSSGVVF